jgi:hypothetical protein
MLLKIAISMMALGRHWIVAPASQRLAAQQAPQGQRAAAQRSVVFHGFGSVLGAGWHKTAGARQHGRDPSLIKTQSELEKFLQFFRHTTYRQLAEYFFNFCKCALHFIG